MVVAAPPQPEVQAGDPYRFTVAEYYRMGEAGIFPPDSQTELIDGRILRMSRLSGWHVEASMLLLRRLFKAVGDDYLLSPRNPVQLDNYSVPRPDMAVITDRRYRGQIPVVRDVSLLVELADVSLRFDAECKVPLYARTGVPEVWLVDLNAAMVTSYRQPRDGSYDRQERFRRGQSLTIAALPSVSIAVDEILPAD